MNIVYPIKDFDLISRIKNELSQYTNNIEKRRYILFVCGLYTGLRISDILKLKVGDITESDVLRIREQKTQKQNVFPINEDLKRIIKKEYKGVDLNELLFPTRYKRLCKEKTITRKTAYNDINTILKAYGINYNVGCHTLRKTFGYSFYKKSGDISMLMMWYNHDSIETTKRYIGIDIDERAKAIKNFKF